MQRSSKYSGASSILIVGAIALALAAVLIGTVVFIHGANDVAYGTLTRDPLSGKPAYLGLLSQAGILLWAAGAAVSFLAVWLLGWRGDRAFMLSAGVLTTMLCIDDAFLLHDEVLPLLGVPETVIYGVYLGLLLGFLLMFARRILQTGFPLLAAGVMFLGVSVAADMWSLPWLDPYLLEDGSKLIGITLWSAYLFHTSGSFVRERAHAA